MPGLNISFSSNVRKALFMLAGTSQVLWFENLVQIKDPIETSVLNLFLWSCSPPCDFQLKMLLLSMHYIAYAFGNLRHLNVHSHEKPVPSLYLS
jgi:hypothetical protein